jgi:hypothetical protein
MTSAARHLLSFFLPSGQVRALCSPLEEAAFSGIDGTLMPTDLGDVNGTEVTDESSEPTVDGGTSAEPNIAIEENI